MDNARHGIRASGDYAVYNGREYFAYDIGDRVRLMSDDDPLPDGFVVSRKSWVNGETIIDKGAIQGLRRVVTTCAWRGHPFEVGIIVGDTAYVTYLGKDFDQVGHLPGMERPDKFEVIGEIPVAELTEVEEQVTETPSSAKRPSRETQSGDQA